MGKTNVSLALTEEDWGVAPLVLTVATRTLVEKDTTSDDFRVNSTYWKPNSLKEETPLR